MNSSTIICGKCNSEYNNEKNVPIFLPCGHTFCKKCLKEIYKKNSYIICPDDGKKLYLALDHYPVNHLILKKINSSKQTSNKKISSTNESNKILNKSVTLKENTEIVKKEISRRNSQILNESMDSSTMNTVLKSGKKTSLNQRVSSSNDLNLQQESKENSEKIVETTPFEKVSSSQQKTFNLKAFRVSCEAYFTLISPYELLKDDVSIVKETKDIENKAKKLSLDKSLNESTIKDNETLNTTTTNFMKYEENIIFSYLNVMKNIIFSLSPNRGTLEENYENFIHLSETTYIETDDGNEKTKQKNYENTNFPHQKEKNTSAEISNRLIETALLFVVVLINYFVVYNEMFLRVYMFIILSNDTKRSISSKSMKKMTLCSKRWLAFAAVIMIEECIYRFSWCLNIYFLGFINMFPLKRLWNCATVIYVLLITGPIGGLNYIVMKIIKYLNRFKILLK